MADRLIPARMADGSGWMVVALVGSWSEPDEHGHRRRPARAVRVGLTETEARALCGQQPAALAAAERERDRLRAALMEALDAAEMEGIDRYRGTDEPRVFVRVLREALQDAEKVEGSER